MAEANLPDPDDHEWEFETRGEVAIWYMKGWQGFPDEDLDAASEHYRERGSQDDIDATIAVFGDETQLPQETQEYMGEVWSENGRYTGVSKIGFVAEGITAMAVKSKMEIPDAEIEDFKDLESAVEWASSS